VNITGTIVLKLPGNFACKTVVQLEDRVRLHIANWVYDMFCRAFKNFLHPKAATILSFTREKSTSDSIRKRLKSLAHFFKHAVKVFLSYGGR
jgi:hypothetical protein